MIGKILGNRYEILEKIGEGGIAVVYKGKCNVLNRYVAIKILRNELISDPDFVEKFKQESLSAASLNHPNIVNIYDSGIENDIYYIVMEYIKGITLKEYITDKGKLDEKEVVNISLQVAEALKHAHHNNIVHRDIKPHNIMITDEGLVKVADFGIAKAASSSTINTASNVIGSVHYFSPEQARGGYVDNKSDIYSLGVVMYEMLTGTVPFNADNHISVAMKHIQEKIVPPSERDESIEVSDDLERVILKCLEKHQSYRYQNADELIKDLTAVKNNIPILFNEARGEYDKDKAPTIVMPKIKARIIDDEENEEQNSSGDFDEGESNNDAFDKFFNQDNVKKTSIIVVEDGDDGKKVKKKANDKNVTKDNAQTKKPTKEKSVNNGKNPGDKETSKPEKKDTFYSTLAGIIAGVGLTCIIGFFLIKALWYVKEVEVPDLIGKTIEEARTLAKESGLILEVKDSDYNDKYEEGQIYDQSEAAGTKVKEKFQLQVLVSKGTKEIIVPKIEGLYGIQASTTLKNMGLQKGEITEEFNDLIPAGVIISQDPKEGASVQSGDKVNYVVSKGPEAIYVKVPRILGLTESEAKSKLTRNNLYYGTVTYENSEEVEKDLVISQSYGEGTEVEQYTRISFVVSLGKYTEGDENQEGNEGDNQGGSEGDNQGGNEGDNQGGNEGDNQGDNQGGELKYSQISIPVPIEKDTVMVTIYRITDAGKDPIFYQEIIVNNPTILVTVSGTGTEYFEVYVDDEIVKDSNGNDRIRVDFN